MLTELYINNIAVIHKAVIKIGKGFNVFTGETGAGKTILISAIDAVMGERTSRDIIRTGEEKAVVSALFEDISPKVCGVLESQGYTCDDNSLLIVREIFATGKNSCKINGAPANVSILKEIASSLVNIHGQRDTGEILLPERHLSIIDTFLDCESELKGYREDFAELEDISREIKRLELDERDKNQKIDMLTFQVNEIEEAKLDDPLEEDNLLARRKMIKNSERIIENLSEAYGSLNGSEEMPGILESYSRLTSSLEDAGQFMENIAQLSEKVSAMQYELEEAAREIADALESFDFDKGEAEDIEQRLDTIYRLKKKYGASIEEILEFCDKASLELQNITTSDKRRLELLAKKDGLYKAVLKKAEDLSLKRVKAAKDFINRIEEELKFLDMENVRLSFLHNKTEPGCNGIDSIEFYAVTNVGEEPKPLSKIASGGESARIMLSIKNVLAQKDEIGTLIFDEVDAGISGKAAGKVGKKLLEVSKNRQVLCVTHLAQVASYADIHNYIYKEVDSGKTFTRIKTLEKAEVFEELARLTSGDVITPTVLKSAEEMWEHAHLTKQ